MMRVLQNLYYCMLSCPSQLTKDLDGLVFLQKSRPGFVGSISFRSWRSPLAGAGLCVQVAKRRYFSRRYFSLGKMQNNGLRKIWKMTTVVGIRFSFFEIISDMCGNESEPSRQQFSLRNPANPISDIFACPTGRLDIKKAH